MLVQENANCTNNNGSEKPIQYIRTWFNCKYICEKDLQKLLWIVSPLAITLTSLADGTILMIEDILLRPARFGPGFDYKIAVSWRCVSCIASEYIKSDCVLIGLESDLIKCVGSRARAKFYYFPSGKWASKIFARTNTITRAANWETALREHKLIAKLNDFDQKDIVYAKNITS